MKNKLLLKLKVSYEHVCRGSMLKKLHVKFYKVEFLNYLEIENQSTSSKQTYTE